MADDAQHRRQRCSQMPQRTGRHRSNKPNRNPIIQTPATRIPRAPGYCCYLFFLNYLRSGRDGSDERAESGRHRLSERDADNRASESDDREDRIGGSGDDHADVLRFMVLGRDLVRCSLSFDLRVERFLSHGDDPVRGSWLDPLVACEFVDGRQWGGTPLKGYLLDAFSRSIDS